MKLGKGKRARIDPPRGGDLGPVRSLPEGKEPKQFEPEGSEPVRSHYKMAGGEVVSGLESVK